MSVLMTSYQNTSSKHNRTHPQTNLFCGMLLIKVVTGHRFELNYWWPKQILGELLASISSNFILWNFSGRSIKVTFRWCSGDNQSVRSSVPLVSRWLWPGNNIILDVVSMVVTCWIVAFLLSVLHTYQNTDRDKNWKIVLSSIYTQCTNLVELCTIPIYHEIYSSIKLSRIYNDNHLNPEVHTPLFATTANPLQLYHSSRAKILDFNSYSAEFLKIY